MSANSDASHQRALGTLDTATVHWQGKNPRSSKYNDIYFSSTDSLDETRYVFIDGNKLCERWSNIESKREPRNHFTIAETGFGTGLNFLVTAKTWFQRPGQTGLLHYVSIEKYPLSRADLSKVLAALPELVPLSDQLITQYPPPTPGFHRLFITDQFTGDTENHHPENSKIIALTLIFGEAEQALQQLCSGDHPSLQYQKQFTVDAWYLDGFAPAKNPEMWTDRIFKCMAKLSQVSTTFATFTAAGTVRRGLEDVGFAVTKQRGHYHKRDMLTGIFGGTKISPGDHSIPQGAGARAIRHSNTSYSIPWYVPCQTMNGREANRGSRVKRVAIIGGGIAGCTAAQALAKRGWQVTLYEKTSSPGAGASGNPQGIIYPRLSFEKSSLSRFNLAALMFSSRFYETFWSANEDENSHFGKRCGVMVLPEKPRDNEVFKRITNNFRGCPEIVSLLDSTQIQSLSGVRLNADHALYFPRSGWIKPGKVCHALVDHPNIDLVHEDVSQLDWDDANSNWKLSGGESSRSYSHKTVIIAVGYQARNFSITQHLPVKAVRGQVSIAPATEASRHLRTVVCGKGYIAPEWDGSHTLGATYNPDTNSPNVRDIDHDSNLAQLTSTDPALLSLLDHPKVNSLDGRVGIRGTTPDYLPIVGPAPRLDNFLSDYAELRRNARADIPVCGSYWPGLYLHCGFGSRGFNYAPLAAELLANIINGEVPALPLDLQIALNPARFIIRDLKRKKI